MSLLFLTGHGSAGGALEAFDLRDRRDEARDEFEPVRAGPVETELSTAGAVARYKALQKGGTAVELLNCGVELLALGPDTHKLAVEAFTRASRFEGAEAEAFYWLGEAHAEAGQPTKAIHYLTESLRHDGARRLTLESLYRMQESEGMRDAARVTAERLSRIADETPTE